jgi:hypothetical protein
MRRGRRKSIKYQQFRINVPRYFLIIRTRTRVHTNTHTHAEIILSSYFGVERMLWQFNGILGVARKDVFKLKFSVARRKAKSSLLLNAKRCATGWMGKVLMWFIHNAIKKLFLDKLQRIAFHRVVKSRF